MNFAAKAGCDVSEKEIAEHKKRERERERERGRCKPTPNERERETGREVREGTSELFIIVDKVRSKGYTEREREDLRD